MILSIRSPSAWLTGAAISLVVLGGCSTASGDDKPSATKHEVPDIRGLEMVDACDSLREEGLKIEVVGDTRGDVCTARAAITGQSPSPGALLEDGSTVTVDVSPTKTIPEG